MQAFLRLLRFINRLLTEATTAFHEIFSSLKNGELLMLPLPADAGEFVNDNYNNIISAGEAGASSTPKPIFMTKKLLFFGTFLSVLFLTTLSFVAKAQTTAYEDAGLPNPTVTSDKEDYQPGEVAHITGSGWTLDQEMHVEFRESPDYPDFHIYDIPVAEDGTWTIDYPIELRHLGVIFTVVATGKTTGYIAQTIFTDANCANPSVSAVGNQTVCQGSTATFSVTSSASDGGALSFIWRKNGTALSSGTTGTGSVITITSTSTGSTLQIANAQPGDADTKYTVSVTNTCGGGNTPRTNNSNNASLVVNATPTATIAINPTSSTSVCSGSTAKIDFTGPNQGIVTYKINSGSDQTIALNNSGVATLTSAALTTNTTFSLVSVKYNTTPDCSTSANGSVAITVDPPSVGGTVSSDQATCNTATLTDLTLSGKTGSVVKWQRSTSNTFPASGPDATVDIANTTTTLSASTLAAFPTGTHFVRAVVQNGVCPVANSSFATITIKAAPTATIEVNGGTPICTGNTSSIKFTGPSMGVVTYNVDGANETTIALNSGGNATLTTPVLTATRSYNLVSVRYNTAPNCETSVSGTATVVVTPNNTAGAASSSPTLCINTALTNITHTTTGATGIGAATGLPNGVTAAWASNQITISGTPTQSGTFNYSIPLTGGCGTVSATGTITVNPNNTAGAASSTPTLCINTALTDITHTTTGATGIGAATGLPNGVTAAWASNQITISGTPTESGTFNYSIPLTGGCGNVSATGTITVTADNTAGAASSSPTLCINTALTDITHTTTGATGIGSATGLPTGVTAAWASNTITISGTPTQSGTFNYSIPLTGGCGNVNATGTITVNPNNTAGAASSSPTLCINTALTDITHTTTGATGIGSATGLPTGVIAAWASNTITISGTPTQSGTFNYSIPLTGGCGSVNATGTITVNPNNTVGAASSTPTLCINTALTDITHTTTGATGIGSATGLPTGVTAAWASNTITISGTPTQSGTFNYSIPLTGGCGSVNATGTITVNPNNTVGAASSTPTLCINTLLTNITHTTTGATGIGSATGLPTGVTAAWASNTITISGTPTQSGTFNYSIPLTGGCGSVSATGTITVQIATDATNPKINGQAGNSIEIVYGCTTPILSITGVGQGTKTYQWYRNTTASNSGGTAIQFATNSSYTVPAATTVGTYYYYVVVTAGCGSKASVVFTVVITPQVAEADGTLYYTGPANAWTPNTSSNSATVTLSAFIKNSNEPDAVCGDIATARITFQVKNSAGAWTNIPSAQNLPVYYVDPNNPSKGGTAAAIVQLNISNNTATQIFDLRVIVGGNYKAAEKYGYSQITISKLVPGGAISGGTLLCGSTSSGLLRPSTLIPSLLGFGVEYVVKQGKVQSPKGKLNLYVSSYSDLNGVNTFPTLNWYKISTNAIASLTITGKTSTTNAKASFTSKANVSKYNFNTGETIPIEGNCTMVLDIEDVSTTGAINFQDKVAITVYRNAGGNWYSNNWVTSQTIARNICGGDVTASGTTTPISSPSVLDESTRVDIVTPGTFKVRAFPNPTTHLFTIDVQSSSNEPIEVKVFDMMGHMVYYRNGLLKQEHHRFGQMLTDGMYMLHVRQGDKQQTITVIKK
jgi:hypothetical protein